MILKVWIENNKTWDIHGNIFDQCWHDLWETLEPVLLKQHSHLLPAFKNNTEIHLTSINSSWIEEGGLSCNRIVLFPMDGCVTKSMSFGKWWSGDFWLDKQGGSGGGTEGEWRGQLPSTRRRPPSVSICLLAYQWIPEQITNREAVDNLELIAEWATKRIGCF